MAVCDSNLLGVLLMHVSTPAEYHLMECEFRLIDKLLVLFDSALFYTDAGCRVCQFDCWLARIG